MSFNDVLKEIEDTRLSQETRNIFKLLVELIKTVTNDRDSKILEMQKKLEENFEQSVNIIAAKDNQINELTTKLQTATESNKSLKAEVTQMKNLHDDLEAYGLIHLFSLVRRSAPIQRVKIAPPLPVT